MFALEKKGTFRGNYFAIGCLASTCSMCGEPDVIKTFVYPDIKRLNSETIMNHNPRIASLFRHHLYGK